MACAKGILVKAGRCYGPVLFWAHRAFVHSTLSSSTWPSSHRSSELFYCKRKEISRSNLLPFLVVLSGNWNYREKWNEIIMGLPELGSNQKPKGWKGCRFRGQTDKVGAKSRALNLSLSATLADRVRGWLGDLFFSFIIRFLVRDSSAPSLHAPNPFSWSWAHEMNFVGGCSKEKD